MEDALRRRVGRGCHGGILPAPPEFLEMQDDLVIALYRLGLSIESACLDVRDEAGQSAAGITADRLKSSEHDEELRYAECRQLARRSVAAHHAGIAYPSAAAAWACWNLVLFGDQSEA